MEEEHQLQAQEQQSKQSVTDRVLTTLGANPREWTVGDRRLAVLAIVMVLAIVIIAVCGYAFEWEWTGLTKPKPKQRMFWDWLDLLLVPVVLALGGYLFNRSETRRTQAIADQQRKDDVLQAYLDQMSRLLTDKELRSKTHWLDDARVTARARSLAALSRLDGERKTSILQFLYEAQLINRWERKLEKKETQELGPDGPTPFDGRIVGLSGADLTSADLRYIYLKGAALNGAILEDTDLREAMLSDIDLGDAYLSGAHLSNADLSGASLVNAELQRKDDRNLSGANLSNADLSNADLSDAVGVTEGQLATCKSLEGATMPNCQKYEDWLGTPEGQQWLRKYKKNLGADKKRKGVYEDWIKTTEGTMWLKAVGDDEENSGAS